MNALIAAWLLFCGLLTIRSFLRTKAKKTTLLARAVTSIAVLLLFGCSQYGRPIGKVNGENIYIKSITIGKSLVRI
jgi:hypothetical protein